MTSTVERYNKVNRDELVKDLNDIKDYVTSQSSDEDDFKHFKKTIKEYDYVIKTCGRYFYFNFENYFTEENTNKIFFKKPLQFTWDDNWNYHYVDLRHYQNNNKLYQYCTVLFAFGSAYLEKFIDINETVIHLIDQPSMKHYDIETLMYYLTRPYQNNIIETDWKVSGWDGTSGRFMYY